jgi:cytochrome b involved in lipid metabolism
MSGCAQFLTWLEANPPLEGHLSARHGFLTPCPRPERLPSEYEPWDEMAQALPELFFSNRTRRTLAELPVLSAHEDGLPSQYLTRASIILSALAHAYWRFGADTFYVERTTQVPSALPEPILAPWQEVSRRLGRVKPERPFQTFYDLFLLNYRMSPRAAEDSPAVIDNIELLVPTFGNETERIFYGAFIEMHVHYTPVVRTLCELEESVLADRPDDVAAGLLTLSGCFVQAAKVWAKIGPRPGSPYFCDPLVWAKTVAILGVPPAGCPQGGTSGACAPIIYLIDALLGRERFETYYGKYVRDDASPMVPCSIHRFARHVANIGLTEYVAAHASTASGRILSDAVRALLDAYAGPKGWLGRHASKAFNYLCVSTITGRNASVSGHERYFSRQTWERAAQNLDASRAERMPRPAEQPRVDAAAPACPVQAHALSECPFRKQLAAVPAPLDALREADGSRSSVPHPSLRQPTDEAAQPPRKIAHSELSRHIDRDDLWIAIDGGVYDVSEYSQRHPGGPAILFAYAGRDVSAAFWQQNLHHSDAVRGLLAKFVVGELSPLPSSASDPSAPSRVLDYLLTLLRGRQAARLQYEHALGGDPRMKLYSDEHGHLQLWCDVMPSALEHLAPGLFKTLTASPRARSVIERAQWLSMACDLRDAASPTLRCAMARRSTSLRTHDLRLLDHLLELASAGLERLERGAPLGAVTEPLIRAVSIIIRRYFNLLAQECDSQIRSLYESLPGRALQLDLERLSEAG